MAQAPSGVKSPSSDASFKLQQFGGMLPAWDDHLLPEGQSQHATDTYLFSGALVGWRKPKLLRTTATPNPGYIYRLPAQQNAAASALLQLLANPIEGDTVTVGEEIYTFTATVSAAYSVLIGATADITVVNLFSALTFDNGAGTNAGTLYGTGTVANPAIDQSGPPTKNTMAADSDPRITVVAPDFGAAYNSTTVGESTGRTRLNWTFDGNDTNNLAGGQNVSLDTDITGAATLMEFVDPDTDVVRSPVVDDSFDRYYWASASAAPQYNTRARIEAGQSPWLLGVPPPGCTPEVVVTGGGDNSTLGNATVTNGSGTAAPGANTIYLIPINPQGAQSITDISAVVGALTSATCGFAGVVYTDLNGSPHELLGVGTIQTGLAAGGTAVSTFTNPIAVSVDIPYWIGFVISEAIDFAVASTGASGVVSLNTFTNGPPGDINNETTGYANLQVWADTVTESVLDARAYVYTYITEYGEESAPSPATIVTGWSNGVWTIGLFQPPPDQIGVTRDIKFLRIYRTLTATGGTTTYFQVTGLDGVDLPVTTATYVDTSSDDIVADNNQLQSQLWTPPPEGLLGFVVAPNGMIVAWKANEIWFCEPYRPHAWPASYVQTCEYPIVGLGISGNSIIAATTGAPYILTGTAPSNMSATKIQNSEPCHSRKSILGNTDGVYYASRNGLILVTQYGVVTNVTETWITREKWQQFTPQSNLQAVFLVSQYYAFQVAPNGNEGALGVRGFTVELNAVDQDSFSIWPQPGGHRMGFQFLTNQLPTGIVALSIDPWSAVCTMIARNGYYYLDFTDDAPSLAVYDWTSKLIQQNTKKNFEIMQFSFMVPPNTPAQNPERKVDPTNDPSWLQPLPDDRYGYVLVYADKVLVTAREIRTPSEFMRILSGFKHETWKFRIISRVRISSLQVGSSVKGLANV